MSDKFEFIDVEYAAYQESDEQYVPSIVKNVQLDGGVTVRLL